MIEFSVDSYNITAFIGQAPNILEYYRKNASFVDDSALQNEGTEVYVVISKGLLVKHYTIIAFRTTPVGYAGFKPGIHYEAQTQTLFIGAGTIIKTIRLIDNKIIFEKDHGFGFWGWGKAGDFVIQQEETAIGIFKLNGQQLWETFVSPPYEFTINNDLISLEFDGIVDRRLLLTGEKV